ncbi:CIC11C00000003357 [Sungouiella intermedia]|uniref:CIC11C00000003357 n=1 Tax=Sungouiella intermedia TaxID=45354 RepID=A0A1L0BQE4_9ASCO|nr:CIC11C00000003357 [[Candida] intermedia]
MKDDHEMQYFLSKSSLENEMAMAANTRLRTKVQFLTVDSRKHVKKENAVFVFNEDFTIKQAADHSVGHFKESALTFNDVFVFFRDSNGEENIPIADVNVNVHSMFSNVDTMVVTNDPNVFKIQSKAEVKDTALIVLVLVILFCVFLIAFIWSIKLFAESNAARDIQRARF